MQLYSVEVYKVKKDFALYTSNYKATNKALNFYACYQNYCETVSEILPHYTIYN